MPCRFVPELIAATALVVVGHALPAVALTTQTATPLSAASDRCEPPDPPAELADAFNKACGASRDTPACDRWWHLRQTGILKARQMLADKRTREEGRTVDACDAGAGVAVAQMDTGVIDRYSFTEQQQPLDQTSMHPMLQRSPGANYTILTRTADGRTYLPLSYSPGPSTSSACKPSNLLGLGVTCAARDSTAEAVPRDTAKHAESVSFLTQRGHGTGTMHVLLQAAPAVAVVPYKFAGGIVVTAGRSGQLSRAIVSASAEDRLEVGHEGRIDVMTMSLGRRSPSQDLEMSLLAAEAQGIIAVAAAGQWIHWSRTRYPARYPSVIGVTGTTIDMTPWWRAGHGPRNTVAAPAVNVWRAGWNGPTKVYETGKGTSFAAPLVAATAAMWIQYHHGRDWLDKKYGRAAVPSAFRWVLEQHGWRMPEDICSDLLAGTPGWGETCSRPRLPWDSTNWGQGILAADKVLAAKLPTREVVCSYVMKTRGAAVYEAICPDKERADAVRVNDADSRVRPVVAAPARATYVSGATVFNKDPRGGWFAPALSFGVIWSGYEVQSPGGPFTQVTIDRHSQEVSIGYAGLVEYAANGPSGKLDVSPAFGPTIGGALTATAIHEDRPERDEWWLGPKLQLTYYRVRMQVGYLRSIHHATGGRVLLNLGVGF